MYPGAVFYHKEADSGKDHEAMKVMDRLYLKDCTLLNNRVEAVIGEVKTLQGNEEDINQLLGYLENHKHQMNYQSYRQ
jgi:hypothetical protein